MLDEEHYVYTLAYPESMDGYVFYAGKGVGDRINHHETEAKRRVPRRPNTNLRSVVEL